MQSYIKYLVFAPLLTFGLVSCNEDGNTRFSEHSDTRRISLTVDPDGQDADAAAAVEENAGSAGMEGESDQDVLDALLDEGSGSGGTDSAADPEVSGDGSAEGSGDGSTLPPESGGTAPGTPAGEGGTGEPGTDGSGPVSGSPTTPGGGDDAPITQAELKACAKMHGVAPERVMVVGTSMAIKARSVAAFKLVGNKPSLFLELVGDATTRLGGICLFLAGNQAKAQVELGLAVGKIVYVGRGHQSEGTITVREGAELGALTADLAGSGSVLRLGGEGVYTCPQVRLRNKKSQFDCQ